MNPNATFSNHFNKRNEAANSRLAGKQEVHSTISQDFSQGKLARQVATLQILGRKSINAQGINARESKEPASSQEPFAKFPNPKVNPSLGGSELSNLRLQDYQMQLMLLEQHQRKNKEEEKRLLMARAEQEELKKSPPLDATVETATPEIGTAWSEVPAMSKDAFKRKWESADDGCGDDQQERKESEKHTALITPARAVSDSPPIPIGTSNRTLHEQSLNNSGEAPNEPPLKKPKLHQAKKKLVPANKSVSVVTAGQNSESRFRVLHQIICHSSFHLDDTIFSDQPYRPSGRKNKDNKQAHFTANHPIDNVSEFIEKSGDIAFIVFRYYRCSDAARWDSVRQRRPRSLQKLFCDEGIVVVSENLQSIIYGVSKCLSHQEVYYPETLHRNEKEPRTDEYSIAFLYHHRTAIASAAAANVSSDVLDQRKALLDYVESNHGHYFAEIDNLIEAGKIQSSNIEMLFCPNDILVTRIGGVLSAYVLRAWPSGGPTISLDCWGWGYNGHWLRRKHRDLAISRPIQTTINIRDLEVYPARFATPEEWTYLQRRGQMFWSLRYQGFVAYEGWDFQAEQYYSNESRWMVDYKTYREMHPKAEVFNFRTKQKVEFDKWSEAIQHYAHLSDNDYVVLPSQIHGFAFKKKKWYELIIDNIRPVNWNKDAFDRLVLPPKIKDMVKSLVLVRASSRDPKDLHILNTRRDDLIAGKGNGLIMLLHGGPGTGKTLTAVLLLDEADVFLEERSLADLERNSLVSVFLRTLEYYDGILMLTSNRVGTFDAAFTSRIQVSLHYESLTARSRRRIWQNFFDMVQVEEEEVDLDDLEKHMDELARHEMNGRQIRNTFTTARQLALFRKETLEWDHLEQALRSVSDFGRYLRKLHGHSEDQWANEEKLR